MERNDVPVGFGMALVQNEEAMNAFAMMTKEQKEYVWAKARNAKSKAEMQQLVADIPDRA